MARSSASFADHIIETLVERGVRRIFGLVGDSLNPIVDAIRRHDDIEWIHVRNEEAAAFAAGAEALVTGELAVCAGSCGPGNTHLVQGLYDAHRNHAPVLAIASHIPSREIGVHFFQATHPEKLFTECSRYVELINSPRQGARVLHRALQESIGGKGVSVIVLPGDVSSMLAEPAPALGAVAEPSREVHPPAAVLDQLVDEVTAAQKIVLFCGAGTEGAHAEVMAFAEHVNAPIGHALGGKEFIQYDNPFDVGMSGLLGYGACHDAIEEADLVLLLGTDFPYTDFLPGEGRGSQAGAARIAQVDIEAHRLGRRCHLDVAVHGDVATVLRELTDRVARKEDRSFLDAMLRKHERALRRVVDAYTRNIEKHTPIHPEFAADIIDDIADADAVFTVDTGMCNVWAARYVTPGPRRRIIGSWRHGTMANALPQAIGVAAAYPQRQVVSFNGDGGLGMLLGELLTVKLHNLPIKMCVFNNSSLGMVKLEMLVEGMPEFATDHDGVNYAAVAEALGIPSVRSEDPRRLRSDLETAFATPGPVLIDIVTDPNALSMPPEITVAQLKGFALAAGKTVMDGGVGKMLTMAKSNLRNIPTPT